MTLKNKFRILHIFDDSVIALKAIFLFEEIDEFQHEYIVISDDATKYSDNLPKTVKLSVLKNNSKLWKELKNEIVKYDIVFLQALSFAKAKALLWTNTKNKTLIWALWGYDLYNFIGYIGKSKKYATTIVKKSLKQKILDFYTYNIIYKSVARKIDICEFLLETDFNLLKKHAKTNAIWMSNCYQFLEDYTNLYENYLITNNYIMVGNSSTPSNNHELVFQKIKTISDRKIICPLSYGDTQYGKKIIALGNSIFHSNFFPITEFMKMDEYLALLKKCSHFIMGHERQQAFGTIVLAAYLGSKVFLQKNNPLYEWFISNGVIVYDINQNNFEQEIIVKQTKEQTNKNRSALFNVLSKQNVVSKQREIILKAIELNNQNATT
ncbi:MAG: TDP-N-acetylfucosamine:lipid II N-acetylfucosaminyltransferase [Bacteroidetes bacterium]|nr:TDP-N-acetylfucosamine:lipid II N-acetylfucosaminyltransferase [Bacteroidota bacterium]